MNPQALINFFNTEIITTRSAKIQHAGFADIGANQDVVAFVSLLPDNVEFTTWDMGLMDSNTPAGVVPNDDPTFGLLRLDVPIKGTNLVAKCAVRWRVLEPMFRYDIYFSTPTSDGCLKVPVSGRTLGIAVNHAGEVWDRLFLGGFVMKSERPKSHVS